MAYEFLHVISLLMPESLINTGSPLTTRRFNALVLNCTQNKYLIGTITRVLITRKAYFNITWIMFVLH